MKIGPTFRLLPLLGALAVAACEDSQLTQPLVDESSLSREDLLALDVLTDAGAVTAALSLAEAPVRIRGKGAGSAAMSQARFRFQEAVAALQAGDRIRAAVRAREATDLIVEAVMTARGPNGLVAMVERAEDLAESVGFDPDGYHEATALQAELRGLAQGARVQLSKGDSLGAGRRSVIAEQRRHQRRKQVRDCRGECVGSPELIVELGATAVALATRLLDEQGADDEQLRFLATAREYQADAEAALEAGDLRRAVHLAQLAHWTALKALVLPGGITVDEARAMLDLAKSLYAQALETDLTDFEVTILQRVRALIEKGEAKLGDGNQRGIGALWRAAVVCTWIIG